jgi:hypothetical protein
MIRALVQNIYVLVRCVFSLQCTFLKMATWVADTRRVISCAYYTFTHLCALVRFTYLSVFYFFPSRDGNWYTFSSTGLYFVYIVFILYNRSTFLKKESKLLMQAQHSYCQYQRVLTVGGFRHFAVETLSVWQTSLLTRLQHLHTFSYDRVSPSDRRCKMSHDLHIFILPAIWDPKVKR